MIGNTKLHKILKNARMLSDLVAWYEAFDPETKKLVVDMVRRDQIRDEGQDSKGNTIGLYSYATELISNGAKQQGDPYTLYDTGETYRSLYLVVLRDAIVVEGNFSKMQGQEWWSEDIYTLNVLNVEKLRKLVAEKYRQYARKVLFKGV